MYRKEANQIVLAASMHFNRSWNPGEPIRNEQKRKLHFQKEKKRKEKNQNQKYHMSQQITIIKVHFKII